MQNPLQFIHARSVILEFISHPFTAECKCNWEQCNCREREREVHKGAIFGAQARWARRKKECTFWPRWELTINFKLGWTFGIDTILFPGLELFFCCRLYLRAKNAPIRPGRRRKKLLVLALFRTESGTHQIEMPSMSTWFYFFASGQTVLSQRNDPKSKDFGFFFSVWIGWNRCLQWRWNWLTKFVLWFRIQQWIWREMPHFGCHCLCSISIDSTYIFLTLFFSEKNLTN